VIARLAQKAPRRRRSPDPATQRPSVDVLRVDQGECPDANRVSGFEQVDSRTILDQQGAESLIGQGDML